MYWFSSILPFNSYLSKGETVVLGALKNFLEKPNLVVWGYGRVATTLFELRPFTDMQIVACVDRSVDKQPQIVKSGNVNYTILPPSILNDLDQGYNVIVTPQKNQEILAFLEDIGYDKNAFICVSFEEARALMIDFIAATCDTYVDNFKCKATYVFFPFTTDIKQPSDLETTLQGYTHIISDRIEWLKGNPPHVAKAHGSIEYYSDEYIENIFTGKNSIRRTTGDLVQENHTSKYVNVVNGMRFTTNQPTVFKSRVHVFGPSIAYGFGIEDSYTFPSCLQRLLNNQEENHYKVLNYGVRGLPLEEYYYIIRTADIFENDHIICVIAGSPGKECKEVLLGHKGITVDLTDYFQRPHEYGEVFFDAGHFHYKGHIASATILFNLIFAEKPNRIDEKAISERGADNSITDNDDFHSYMDFLDICKQEANLASGSVVGSIVVNANPFTLGHYHLINIASKMVDFLYVFVVEEERSAFSFKVRYDLVVKGTEDIHNVKVIPSGKFIVSNITFPEYFDKDNETETNVVPSLDIEIFGEFIAHW